MRNPMPLNVKQTSDLLNNMCKSENKTEKAIGQLVLDMCEYDPRSDIANAMATMDAERCINILQSLKLRLEGWTHSGIEGLKW